jgi:hypothetical protein
MNPGGRMNEKNKEIVLSGVNENLVVDVSTVLYLKFPVKFKEAFDTKTARPILATVTEDDNTTKLSYVFSNDTLKPKIQK